MVAKPSTATLAENPQSPDLHDKVKACLDSSTDFTGICYRTTAYEWATRHDLISGVGSRLNGGRWNPPNLFNVVYLSCTLDTATAEYFQTNRKRGLPDHEAMPKVDNAVSCHLTRVLDLTRSKVRTTLGMTETQISNTAFGKGSTESSTQAIGRLAHGLCFQGLLVPSAALPGGQNIVVFPEKLTIKMQIQNIHKLPARRRRFSPDTKTF